MTHDYQCPHCRGEMRRMSRNLDFFCRACFTSVVVLDDRWVEVLHIDDEGPRMQPIEVCHRRTTCPLAPAKTGPLVPLAS